MEINNEFKEIQERMKAQGYEPIMPITAYLSHPGDDDIPTRYSRGRTFLLFGKPLGNITIFKVCGPKYSYDIQKIGSKRIYLYNNMTGKVSEEIEVNAKFIKEYEDFYDEYFFNFLY